MAVTVLSDEVWSNIDGKRLAWAEEMEAIRKGKVVFVPVGERKADTLRVTLYEAAKRNNLAVSVRAYSHNGVDGFAVKARSE